MKTRQHRLISLCSALFIISMITVIPYSTSKPIVKAISIKEKITEKLYTTIQNIIPNTGILKQVMTLIGIILLVPAAFFLFIGLYLIFKMGGTFAPAGLVFCLFGLGFSILSVLFLLIGSYVPAVMKYKMNLEISSIPLP